MNKYLVKFQSSIFAIIVILAFASFAKAEINSSIYIGARTKPSGTNLIAEGAYDGLLWGAFQKDNPLYGYYRAGLRGGGSPTAEAFIQISPIAPLVFEVQKGSTSRFFSTSNFDCEKYQCQGTVERTEYSVKLGAGYQNIVFLGGLLWRDLKTPVETKKVFIELENFIVLPGNHRYLENYALLGYKLPNDRLAAIVYSAGEVSAGDQRSSSLYGVYRMKWQQNALSSAIGYYVSDHEHLTGPSAVFSLTRNFGESLSLF